MTLAELQHFFAQAVTTGSGPLPGLEQVFVSDPRLSASERLAIYNRGYYYRLLDALRSVFERTAQRLGSPEFERLALAYLAEHPSRHPAVERVGRLFPQYLQGQTCVPSTLAELAALEWARLQALVAPNPAHILASTQLFPHSRLHFVPSLQLLLLDSGALTAFGALDLLLPQAEAKRRKVAIWRRQHRVSHLPLESQEAEALTLALEGGSVSRICACFDTGNQAADVQRAFQVLSAWFAREWLESLTLLRA